MKKNALTLAMAGLGLASVLTLQGCNLSDEQNDAGQVQVTVTDAEEDFVTYRVDVSNITFIRADGTRVNALPINTSMDFVQYQDVSEWFATLSIPAGVYQAVELNLDYSNSEVVVETDAGEHVIAEVVDVQGNAVTELTMTMNLNGEEGFTVRRGKLSQLTLDLDLEASNRIISQSPAMVQVEPFMLATAYIDEGRDLRVRGLLSQVDVASETFTAEVLPMRLRSGAFGSAAVMTNSDTRFEINGEEFVGTAGLTALAELEAGVAIVSYGEHVKGEAKLLAETVVAGSSVPWDQSDLVKGVVTARTENSISLSGAIVETRDGIAQFGGDIQLTVDNETDVTGYILGDASLANIAVGQRIIAIGDATIDGAEVTFDADQVRLKFSQAVGTVVETTPLTLDLERYNGRRLALYNFAETGVDMNNDVDENAFEVETFTLDTATIEQDDVVAVRGYAAAYATAPTDFEAVSIITPNFDNSAVAYSARSVLGLGLTIEANGSLTLGLTDSSGIKFAGVPFSLSATQTVSAIVSSESGEGRYALRYAATAESAAYVVVYTDYAEFQLALSAALDSGLSAKHMATKGFYDAELATIAASQMTVSLK